ncbi:MAG: hypothetical protein IT460_14305 [Planctomycetes bacterium]|nr:hypothetical protein [Planctomycetota bacterium]
MRSSGPRLSKAAPVLALALAVTLGPSARAADPPPAPAAPPAPAPAPALPPLPPGIAARVRNQDLTEVEFRRRLVTATKADREDPRSGPAVVERLVVEETVVLAEAERLGIRVSAEDYGRRYDELDRLTRTKTLGQQGLSDVMREMKTSPEEFRKRLEDQIRKERIASHPSYLGDTLPKEENARYAQVEVVVGDLLKKAKVERSNLPPGVVLLVNGRPITEDRLGEELALRLSDSEVRRHLREMCLTMLLDQEGLAFTAAQVDEALRLERPLWERMSEEAITPERKTLSFDAFLTYRYGASVEELKASAYRRGLFALRMRFWNALTDDEVRAEWVRGAEAQYGTSVVVTDFVVSFQIPKAVFESSQRRPRAEASRLASDLVRRARAGERVDALRKEVAERKDRSFVAERRSLVRRGNDLPLFEAASAVADGAVTDPVETISEFHVLARETLRPAPPFEKIRDVVRHDLVDAKAQHWVQDMLQTQVRTAR